MRLWKPNFFRRIFVLKTTFLCRNNVVEIFYGFHGLIETAKATSAVTLKLLKPTISNDYLKFLNDFEAICETALAPESRPWGDCLMKKPRVKNLMTLSL
jgi:hypothetical protein